MKLAQKLMKNTNYICFCLSCMKTLTYLDNIYKHYVKDKHRLYLNNDILKYRIIFHLLNEIDMELPKVNLLSKKEVFELKYNKFVKNI